MNAKSLTPTILGLGMFVSLQAAPPRLLPFQGRLTDAGGTPVPDGAKVVQFKIYDAPTGGNAVWNGEVQKLTVNGGLVSTLLGSKADLSGVDFNQALYLEITVDANADAQITVADPPLLPRQSILPVVFAVEAGVARSANSVADGSVTSQKIANGAVGGAQMAVGAAVANIGTGGIGNNQISDGAISGVKLTDRAILGSKLQLNAVGAAELAIGAVGSEQISDGSVTLQKLAPRPAGSTRGSISQSLLGTDAAVTFGSATIASSEITLNTGGRPILVFLSNGQLSWSNTGGNALFSVAIRINRKNVTTGQVVAVGDDFVYSGPYDGSADRFPRVPASLMTLDRPPAGQYVYYLVYSIPTGGRLTISGSLTALEL